MTQKHTSTPWDLDGTHIYDKEEGCVASCDLERDAAFIVRACNVHEELVSLIESLGENANGGYFNKSLLDAEWCKRAKTTLAKSRGEA